MLDKIQASLQLEPDPDPALHHPMGGDMSKEFIGKATRNEFREDLVGHTFREIEMIFDAGGLSPRKSDYEPTGRRPTAKPGRDATTPTLISRPSRTISQAARHLRRDHRQLGTR